MNVESGGREPDNSQAFLVRLWPGEVANPDEAASLERDGIRVQGKVTHLLSGKGSSFSDAETLMRLLLGMMLATGGDVDLKEEVSNTGNTGNTGETR